MKNRFLLRPIALALGLLTLAVSEATAQSGVQFNFNSAKAAGANAAIMAYLGDPVPAPANLDPKYTPEGLATAFRQFCKNVGSEILELAVDDTEFPYLVHGVVKGGRFHDEMNSGLNALPGYTYGGASSGRSRESSYFALNMTPLKSYPPDTAEAIRRRLMIRLQMLNAVWRPVH